MSEESIKDEWDIKLFPSDTGEIEAELIRPPVNARGFIIEVDIIRAYVGYVYDARDIVGTYKSQSYGAYFNKGVTVSDRSNLFYDNDSVGKDATMSLGGNRNLTERVQANYLYLKWIY